MNREEIKKWNEEVRARTLRNCWVYINGEHIKDARIGTVKVFKALKTSPGMIGMARLMLDGHMYLEAGDSIQFSDNLTDELILKGVVTSVKRASRNVTPFEILVRVSWYYL